MLKVVKVGQILEHQPAISLRPVETTESSELKEEENDQSVDNGAPGSEREPMNPQNL